MIPFDYIYVNTSIFANRGCSDRIYLSAQVLKTGVIIADLPGTTHNLRSSLKLCVSNFIQATEIVIWLEPKWPKDTF